MRTASDRERSASDLTARARIRESAIECFAADGFDASFRAIAARAGVSPALITHHFGSKAALRRECDAEVLRQYRVLKSEGVARPSSQFLEALTAPGMSATLQVYILRVILAGGDPARGFMDRLVDDMRPILAEGVASGLVRPSRDEEARLRYLIYQSMGAGVVQLVLMPRASPDDFVASLREGQRDSFLPILELFTEGMLTDPQMLDDYVQYLGESTSRPTRTPSTDPPETDTKDTARRRPKARNRP